MDKKILIVGHTGTGMTALTEQVMKDHGMLPTIINIDKNTDATTLAEAIEKESYMVITNPYKELKEPSFHTSPQYDKLYAYLKDKRTILEEYKLIKSKQSDLSKSMRDFVVGLVEEEE